MQHNVRFNGRLDVDIGGQVASLVQNNDNQPCSNRIRAARVGYTIRMRQEGSAESGAKQINTRFRIPAKPRASDCPEPDTWGRTRMN